MTEYDRVNTNMKHWQEDYYQKTSHTQKLFFAETELINDLIESINLRVKQNQDGLQHHLHRIVTLENAGQKSDDLTKEIQKVIDKFEIEIQKISVMQA